MSATSFHAPEVALLGRLPAVGTALKVLARSTGLRVALIACVSDDRWTCAAIHDEAGFGISPGDELTVMDTY